MKKVFSIFLLSFGFLFLISGIVQADIVPCGQGSPTIINPTPPPAYITNPAWHRCEFSDIGQLILNLYNYILAIGISLATLGIVMGGIVLIFSAGNSALVGKARQIITGCIFGIVLIFGGWLIIHTVAWALGIVPDIFTFPT